MANMRILIRMVFAIFIAKGINSLGSVYDDFCGCCDCIKKNGYEEDYKRRMGQRVRLPQNTYTETAAINSLVCTQSGDCFECNEC